MAERMNTLGRIIHHMTDQVLVMGLFYTLTPLLVSRRVVGMQAPKATGSNSAWNAHEWDVR